MFVFAAMRIAAAGGGVPEAVWVALLAFVGVVFTALGGYFIAKRVNSGSIDTSAAADLWQESQAMRKELRDETVDLRGQLDALRSDFAAAATERDSCKRETEALKVKMAKMEGELTALKRRRPR